MKNLLDIWNGLTSILSGIISIIALLFFPFIWLKKYVYTKLNKEIIETKNEIVPIEIMEKKGGE